MAANTNSPLRAKPSPAHPTTLASRSKTRPTERALEIPDFRTLFPFAGTDLPVQ
jgi:hypothetical protein